MQLLGLPLLPKPEWRHSGSATKPDGKLWPHPAPQPQGGCHTDLDSESLSLFFARGSAEEGGGGAPSPPLPHGLGEGGDRVPSDLHPERTDRTPGMAPGVSSGAERLARRLPAGDPSAHAPTPSLRHTGCARLEPAPAGEAGADREGTSRESCGAVGRPSRALPPLSRIGSSASAFSGSDAGRLPRRNASPRARWGPSRRGVHGGRARRLASTRASLASGAGAAGSGPQADAGGRSRGGPDQVCGSLLCGECSAS